MSTRRSASASASPRKEARRSQAHSVARSSHQAARQSQRDTDRKDDSEAEVDAQMEEEGEGEDVGGLSTWGSGEPDQAEAPGIILAMNTYLTDPRGDVEKFEQLLSKLDSRTENKLDKLAQLEQEDAELKTELTKLRSQSTRSALDWRSKALHLAEMDKLEGKKFDLLKKITEAENRRDGLQARLVEARDEEEELNRGKPLERGEFDRQGLLLSIYRKVGFHPIYTNNQTKSTASAPFKSLNCVPASRKRTTLHRVDEAYLRETGQTPFWVAEQLWKAVE